MIVSSFLLVSLPWCNLQNVQTVKMWKCSLCGRATFAGRGFHSWSCRPVFRPSLTCGCSLKLHNYTIIFLTCNLWTYWKTAVFSFINKYKKDKV